jgi:polysaccharide export outer membrane protein
LDFNLTPEFNQTAITVQPDGYVTLHGIGDVYVEGQTVPEATKSIRQAYSKILHDPVIVITLKDFDKPYFIVGGQVGKPGKYDLRGDTTVSQAVAIAGGFDDNAKHSQVLLFRRVSNDWVEVKKIDLKQMLQAANLSEDLHLRPGDMLFVPKNALSKVRPWIPYPSLGMYFNPLY